FRRVCRARAARWVGCACRAWSSSLSKSRHTGTPKARATVTSDEARGSVSGCSMRAIASRCRPVRRAISVRLKPSAFRSRLMDSTVGPITQTLLAVKSPYAGGAHGHERLEVGRADADAPTDFHRGQLPLVEPVPHRGRAHMSNPRGFADRHGVLEPRRAAAAAARSRG